MAEQKYNWKRFWCPREGSFSLGDGGYLVDPDSEGSRYVHQDIVPFSAIASKPCLVLLGEPGIGKTTVIEEECDKARALQNETGEQVLFIDLSAYMDVMLHRAIFENEVFKAWKEGKHRLHLFLDGLDQCKHHIFTISKLLTTELANYPVERLSLRITCRSADWPSSLEEALKSLWKGKSEKDVGIYELVPLRRADVIEAARVEQLDHQAFLKAIDEKNAVPLAIKPITLDFLINVYRRNGQFPPTQAEFYLEGCRILCEEPDLARREAGLTGNLSAEQRLAVAARIAAITVFANRFAVWIELDLGNVPDGDLTIREISGGGERAQGNRFAVNEESAKETLATGLFSLRDLNRQGWAHQTYAEFLAAYYINHNMDMSQSMGLLTHTDDLKITPQLQETAAWLAGMNHSVFDEILKTDPEVLLRSDVAKADYGSRKRLVQALLDQCEKEKVFDTDLRHQYKNLTHPDLAEQLKPYIIDVDKDEGVRRVAIRIAGDCKQEALRDELVEIALDGSQPSLIRIAATGATINIGDEDGKSRLKPLALGEAGDDPDDGLKGYGLKAVWPEHMTASELFGALAVPKNVHLFGIYKRFLLSNPIRHLCSEDLVVALEWVSKHDPHIHTRNCFHKIQDEIMFLAFQNLDVSNVLGAFARAAYLRLKQNYDRFLNDQALYINLLKCRAEKRRKVVEAILDIMPEPEGNYFSLVFSHLVVNSDTCWLIERLGAAASDDKKKAWAELIERVFDRSNSNQISAVLEACQAHPILAERCANHIGAITLNSSLARKKKAEYFEIEKLMQPRSKPLLKPPPSKRIALLLDRYESGDLDAWWRLVRELTLKHDSTHYDGNEWESDLTDLPGWTAGDKNIRQRIIDAAKKYLLEYTPDPEKWLVTKTFNTSAFSGFNAFLLLRKVEPKFMASLSPEIWQKWATMILAFPFLSGDGKNAHISLLEKAYAHASGQIIKNLMVLIDKENEDRDHIFTIHKIESCWDSKLADALMGKVRDDKLKPKCMRCLLDSLLEHDARGARQFAERLVVLHSSINEDVRVRAKEAAVSLMAYADDAGWPVVWPAIQEDEEYGKSVMLYFAHDLDLKGKGFATKLSEDKLAELYIWLENRYPHAKDPDLGTGGFVTAGVAVAQFRDNLLRHLVLRGTQHAVNAVRCIEKEFPNLAWLKWTLWDARRNYRGTSWIPFEPREIIELATSNEKRLIQSGEQLLEVILEALRRLQDDMQGKSGSLVLLWDKRDEEVYRPKEESIFSIFVRQHLERELKQRGIFPFREVRISERIGSKPGEDVDILVEAITSQAQDEAIDNLRVIIEVKGCWHKEVKTAIRTQLAKRYLNDRGYCQHGIYLVVWCNCDLWDNRDYRLKEARRQFPDINKAREFFNEQAAELSQGSILLKAFVINAALP